MTTATADEQIVRLVEGADRIVGAELVGAYLFGSAVMGGLRPSSDLDVLAVTARRTTRDERDALIDHLLDISLHPRAVELTVVVADDIRPWRHPPRMELQYGEWWRTAFERGEREPWPEVNPDLTTLIALTLASSRSLRGPHAASIFEPVAYHDLVAAMTRCVPDLVADVDTDTRNVVLTLARVWRTVATGDLVSKDAAADWALLRLAGNDRAVLFRARSIYVGEHVEEWDDLRGQVRRHVDVLVGEIRRSAREAGC